jgi:hypothetical protein
LVAPYIHEHKAILRSRHPRKSDSEITRDHMATFGGWLQTRLINDINVEYQLYLLAKTPSSTVLTFQEYEINRNTF